jgi:hypothetical protein
MPPPGMPPVFRHRLRVLGVEERGLLRDEAQRQVGDVAAVGGLAPLLAEGELLILLHAVERRLPVLLRTLDPLDPRRDQPLAPLLDLGLVARDDVLALAVGRHELVGWRQACARV